MAQVLITEAPIQESEISASRGMIRIRGFDVHASGEDDARAIVLRERNIDEGFVYVSPEGTVPDPAVICKRIRVRSRVPAPTGGTGLYRVECEFGYPDTRVRPLVTLYSGRRYWLTSQRITVPADHDRHGDPIQNAVEEPIDPPRTKRSRVRILNAEWVRQGSDLLALQAFYDQYLDKLNETPFFGAPRGCLICDTADVFEMAGQPQFGLRKFRVFFQFEFAKPKRLNSGGTMTDYEGWIETLIHRGNRFWHISLGEYHMFTEDPADRNRPLNQKRGKVLSQPVNLNEAGTDQIPHGTPPFIQTVEHYDYAEFNTIP